MAIRPRGSYGAPYPFHAIIAGQGVMLERQPDGSPSWTERKVSYFDQASLISATDRNYQMFPPEFEFPRAQETFSGGAGQADQKPDVNNRYWYADAVDCSSGWPVLGPDVTTSAAAIGSRQVNQFIEFNGKVYCAAGTRLFVRPDDVSAWTNITPGTDFAANVGKMAVFRGTQGAAHLFIPIGVGANYYAMTTGEAFTQFVGTQTAVAFEVIGNELWLATRESNQWGIKKAEDGGTAATWGAMTTVGDANWAINDIQAVNERLIAGKEDGIYSVSADAFTIDEQLTPEMRSQAASTNCVNNITWNGSLIFRYAGGLYRYSPDSGDLLQIGPELVESNTSPVKGVINAMAGQAGLYLWGAIYNAATGHSYLAKYGSWRSSEQGQMEFHPVWHYSLAKFTSKVVTSMFCSSGSYLATPQPRMYVGCSDGTVFYFPLSRFANPLDDANYRFTTAVAGGTLYLSRYTANFPFEDKLIKAVGIGGRQLNGSSQQITAAYKVASDVSYTTIGAVQTDPGDRVNVTGNVASKAIDFTLNLVSTSNTTSPVLTHFVIYAALRTQALKEINATIVAADEVMDLSNKPCRATWRDIRSAMESAMTTNGAFTVINPAGEEITVLGRDFAHGYNPAGDDTKRGQNWSEKIRMIQTQASASRGTWERAGAYTWGSLGAFRWSDCTII